MSQALDAVNLARDLAGMALCAVASVFAIAGTLGMLLQKDPYTRLQASSLVGTTATFSVLLAALVTAPSVAIAARMVVIIAFFLISNPTTTHIIAKYAWNSGIAPRTAPRARKPGAKVAGDDDD
ncbi:MAG TPA: monovalent cation/H(+) antiporter subunit G [Spirochaetales bacterium]|nr:monovalent cation/H(+) antiporter subunit G [Spirochaetales bacterium]HPG85476.1 monovalent cation/H(+) antiporter subunit G [Spirochaetales bacterium]HPM72443.1 monovalent cation/H(+) antiporter subunit G [Spirochaetales bacterium]